MLFSQRLGDRTRINVRPVQSTHPWPLGCVRSIHPLVRKLFFLVSHWKETDSESVSLLACPMTFWIHWNTIPFGKSSSISAIHTAEPRKGVYVQPSPPRLVSELLQDTGWPLHVCIPAPPRTAPDALWAPHLSRSRYWLAPALLMPINLVSNASHLCAQGTVCANEWLAAILVISLKQTKRNPCSSLLKKPSPKDCSTWELRFIDKSPKAP